MITAVKLRMKSIIAIQLGISGPLNRYMTAVVLSVIPHSGISNLIYKELHGLDQ